MICGTCAKAGGLLPAVQKIDPSLIQSRKEAFEMIAELHAECRGGTWCDCQHKIPEPVS